MRTLDTAAKRFLIQHLEYPAGRWNGNSASASADTIENAKASADALWPSDLASAWQTISDAATGETWARANGDRDWLHHEPVSPAIAARSDAVEPS